MKVDFSTITVYEVIALVLSFIAIVVPFIKWSWYKWVVKPVLKHLPTGKVYPCFNMSGSYLKVESVFEALNKPITVKNIALRMTRVRDEKKLNQNWSSFWSPVTQSFKEGFSSTSETAHPFRIEKDSLTTAFTEFEDPHNSLNRSLAEFEMERDFFIKDCLDKMLDYRAALDKFRESSMYKKMYDILLQEFFWSIGNYKIEIIVKYGKEKKVFSYNFDINEAEHNKLLHNLNETLIVPIKRAYQQRLDFSLVVLNLKIDD